MTDVSLIGFGGATNLPVWLGIARGHYAAQGLNLAFQRTTGSREQMQELMAGRHQFCSTAFDNIIAYTEGQGADQLPDFDLKAIMGVHSGLNSVVAVPDVKSYADLKGRPMAVDSPKSGYATALYEIIRRKTGMEPERDYPLAIVGGTAGRVKALREGTAAVGIVSSPEDLQLRRDGFTILGDAAEELGAMQGSCYCVRSSWAKANAPLVEAFVRATIVATDEVFADKRAAIDVLRTRLPVISEQDASEMYDRLTGPGGFNRRAVLNEAGMRTVLQLRRDAGSKAAEPSRYIDQSWYERALG